MDEEEEEELWYEEQNINEQIYYQQQFIYILLTIDDKFLHLEFPPSWTKQAFTTNIGLGRGIIKHKRTKLRHVDVYNQWCGYPETFSSLLHITKQEFDLILKDISCMKFHHDSNLNMSIANKLLLSLHFVIQYIGANNLAAMFNVSGYYVSKVLDEMLPHLVEYFVKFIPNKKVSQTSSRLHPRITYIIDGTLHKIQKQHGAPDVNYNGHYLMHGKVTVILLDFDSRVVAFITNIKGKIHDSLIATYGKLFKQIIGTDLALGDPGFLGVSYVVPGFKSGSVKSWEQRVFDKISRSEQVLIENANKGIKECKSVNKQDTFRHGDHRLLACVFISIGLYNMKLDWGYYK